jgi:iron complex outermembrane receptor protein
MQAHRSYSRVHVPAVAQRSRLLRLGLRLRLLPLSIGLAFAAPAVVLAQTAAPAPAGAASAPTQLTTVTVTAERRTENIKDVPSAVSTLSGEKLDVINSSGEDVRALSGRVPSLNIESSFGRAFPRFYIRGYGNTDFHLNASQPVSLIYDDVVQENPILKGFPVFDVASVEVLAGPQGTLFGRNTPAGVVKFDSVHPSQQREGYFNASYGTFGTVNLEGAYTLPLSSEWSSRLSLQTQHRDNWVTNTAPKPQNDKLEGYDDTAGRVQFLYQPTGSFSALFNAHARDLTGTARLFRANIIAPGTNNLVPGFDPYQISIDGKNRQTLSSAGASAKLRWKFGDLALSSITGFEHVSAFSRGDVDGGYGAPYAPDGVYGPGFIPFSDETSDALQGHTQWSQEFRLESDAPGPFKWQGGLYYFNEKFGIDSLVYDTIFDGPTTEVKSHQSNTAWAAFGSVNYDLTSDFKLRAGLRYTQDKKSLTTTPTTDTAVDTSAGLSKSTSDSRVNWDLSGTYAATKDVNLYARVATGFRASSIFPASDFNPLSSAPPETNTSYEVGAKGDLWDKRARFSASLFHYDVKNQQLSAVGGSDNKTLLLSAKKAIGQGVELNLDAYLTEHLLVTLSGSYNLTKIKDPNLTVGVCAACTVTNRTTTTAGGATLAYIDGNALPQAPKVVANFTARYGIPTATGGEWFAYTDWVYRSSVNFFLYQSVEFTGKSLTEGGLRLGYDWDDGKYELAAFGRNITNQIRVVGGIDFNNLTGFINDPRTFGVQFKAVF